jgi:hypothetical protein
MALAFFLNLLFCVKTYIIPAMEGRKGIPPPLPAISQLPFISKVFLTFSFLTFCRVVYIAYSI